MSATDRCGCDESKLCYRELTRYAQDLERLMAWLKVIRDEGDCTRDAEGNCMGVGYCMQATAAAALDGQWPLGMEPEGDHAAE